VDEQTLINFVHAVLGGGAASTIVIGVTKFLFQRILKSMEDSAKNLQDVLIKLSAINVKLEILDHHHITLNKVSELLQEHDRKIAVLQARIDGGQKPTNTNSGS
jgi:hypothetical protein